MKSIEQIKECTEDLCDLRERLFVQIKKELAADGGCKSNEGTFSIIMPNYFQELADNVMYDEPWVLELDCYVLGGSRHHYWRGRTLREALDKAIKDITKWIADSEKWLKESEGKVW